MGFHVWAVDLNRQIVRHKSPKSIAKLTDFDSIGLSADRVPKSHFEYLNCHASKPPPTPILRGYCGDGAGAEDCECCEGFKVRLNSRASTGIRTGDGELQPS